MSQSPIYQSKEVNDALKEIADQYTIIEVLSLQLTAYQHTEEEVFLVENQIQICKDNIQGLMQELH
jgi:hypothetical protein